MTKAKFLATATAILIASGFVPTSAFSRGSAAAQERQACNSKCGALSAPGSLPSPQTLACFKKCDEANAARQPK
jgi:hypothetical protein